MEPQAPPSFFGGPSNLPGIDTAAIDHLLISGSWVEIEKGSLQALTGVRPPFGHDINPMVTVTTPDGAQAAIFISAIEGWSPLEVA